MAEVDWPAALRVGFGVGVVLVLIVCLIGIALTGPVVVRSPPRSVHVLVSGESLRSTVERLCTDFAPRDYRHPENLDRAADWLAAEFREAGYRVELQDYTTEQGRFRNVVAFQPGTDPKAGNVVIGAHYDAVEGSPGANDNASGVAVLLELARTLPQRSVREGRYFVAFSTEEPPFFRGEGMGSHVFASRLKETGVPVSLMIALDLVGYYSEEPKSQSFPFPGVGLLYPDHANFIAVVGDMGSGSSILRVKRGLMSSKTIDVHSFRAPTAVPGVDWSDHSAFRQLGYPAVLISDTAFMRYDHYHTASDTPDRLDYVMMASLVQALHGLLWDPSAA
jgi:hypothetical protein